MITYDVNFGYGTGWIAIVPPGTVATVHNDMNKVLYYKFGSSSVTTGVPLRKGEYIKIPETVYFKDNPGFSVKLTIVSD